MSDFRVTVDDDKARRQLEQFQLMLLDLRSFWPRVVPLFIGWIRDQFESEGAWAGAGWAPLSPTYAAWKAQRYPGRSILIRDGDLRQVASRPDRDATPHSLTLTIRDPKLGFHQEGTSRMPARPLLPGRLPVSAVRDVEQAAEDYVADLMRRIFGR